MMGILTVIFSFSILFIIVISVLLVTGMPVTKGIRIAMYCVCILAFFGAMLLLDTIGEIERLQKEKLDKYEQVTFTVYKKK